MHLDKGRVYGDCLGFGNRSAFENRWVSLDLD